jgi:tRNA threonylcarbamoyladenosine biosynthesis protein TsaB
VRILAVDTALGACSAAVLEDDAVLAHRFEAMARGHAERLAPMVEETLREAGLAPVLLDRLAVTVGPGTFTGQRVGLALMRAMRLALDRPLIGVTTLEAMAAAAGGTRMAVMHDAKRGEAYLLLSEHMRIVLPPTVLAWDDALARIAAFGPATLAGTGAAAAAASLGPDFALSSVTQPDALWVARLARSRPAPAAVPGPLYLRAPDAKLPART